MERPEGSAAVGWAVELRHGVDNWVPGVVVDVDPDSGDVVIQTSDGAYDKVEAAAGRERVRFVRKMTGGGAPDGDGDGDGGDAAARRVEEQRRWLEEFDAGGGDGEDAGEAAQAAAAQPPATGAPDPGSWGIVYGDDEQREGGSAGEAPRLDATGHVPGLRLPGAATPQRTLARSDPAAELGRPGAAPAGAPAGATADAPASPPRVGRQSVVGPDEAVVNGAVIEARGLPLRRRPGHEFDEDDEEKAAESKRATGECNACVKVCFVAPGGKSLLFRRKTELHRTDVVVGTTTPTWLRGDGAFKLAVAAPTSPSGEPLAWNKVGGDLLFQVQHQAGGSRLEVLGQVLVPIRELVDARMQAGQQRLRDKWYTVEAPAGGRTMRGGGVVAVGGAPTAGELRVRMQLVLPGDDAADAGVHAVVAGVRTEGNASRGRSYGTKTQAELESEVIFGLDTVAEGLSPAPNDSPGGAASPTPFTSPPLARAPQAQRRGGDGEGKQRDSAPAAESRVAGDGAHAPALVTRPFGATRRPTRRAAGTAGGSGAAVGGKEPEERKEGRSRQVGSKQARSAAAVAIRSRRNRGTRGGTLATAPVVERPPLRRKHAGGAVPDPVRDESHAGRVRRKWLKKVHRDNKVQRRHLRDTERLQKKKLEAEKKAMEEGPRARYVASSLINRRRHDRAVAEENRAAKGRTWLASSEKQATRANKRDRAARAAKRAEERKAAEAADNALEAALRKATREGMQAARASRRRASKETKPSAPPGTARRAYEEHAALYERLQAMRTQIQVAGDDLANTKTAVRRSERAVQRMQRQLRDAAAAPEPVSAEARRPPPKSGDGWMSALGRELTGADERAAAATKKSRRGPAPLPKGVSEVDLRKLQDEATALHAEFHRLDRERREAERSERAAADDAAAVEEELRSARVALERARLRQRWEQLRDLRGARGELPEDARAAFDKAAADQAMEGKQAEQYQRSLDEAEAAIREVRVAKLALEEQIAAQERRQSRLAADDADITTQLRAKLARKQHRLEEETAKREKQRASFEEVMSEGRAVRLRAEIRDLHVKLLHRTQRKIESAKAEGEVAAEIETRKRMFEAKLRAEDAARGVSLS